MIRNRLYVLALVAGACNFDHGASVTPDGPPGEVTVSFDSASSMVDEASGTVDIPVTLSGPATETVTVDYATGSGTAVQPDDFTLPGGMLTFLPGETEQTITVAIVSDAIEEDDETIVVELSQPAGASLGTTTTHTLTISSDILPRVSFVDAAASSASEASSPEVEVRLDRAPSAEVTVELGVAGTASAADRGVTDGQVITFAANQTSQLVPLGIVEDGIDEGDETVELALQNPSPGLMLASADVTRTHTIVDDDDPPTVAFAQATAAVNEAMTTVDLTVQLSAASSFAVTVPFSIAGASTADGSEDYTLATASPLMIPAGMTSATISFDIQADSLDEANETVIVDVGTPTNATLGAIASETLTIADDDTAPTVAFTSPGSMPNEGDSNITLTVQLSDISGQDVTVPYTIGAATTATAPADYTIAPASPLVIPAGETSTTITIAMKEDTLDEPDEQVIVALGTPTNATLGMPATYTLKIRDDDQRPDVSWNPVESNLTEDEGTHPANQPRSVTLTLVLSAASGQPVMVPILYTGTATVGTDYTGPASVMFAAGATSADVVLSIVRDSMKETGPDETIVMTIDSMNVTNAGTQMPVVRTYSIKDDD